ncbi:hypothetical protein VDIAB_270868 [Vibrio diabolicus]|nr:hypothetical protein VDIAB_270868 [Vibrio diabolicus]
MFLVLFPSPMSFVYAVAHTKNLGKHSFVKISGVISLKIN